MSAGDHHLGDDLQDALDGRLSPERQASVEEHLAACDQCRAEIEAWRQAKRAVRGMTRVALPAELDGQLRAALDRVHDEPARAIPRRWLSWAAAATLLVAIAAGWFTFRPRDPADAAFARFAQYADSGLALDRVTSQPPVLEQYFADGRVGFPTRVFDFAMMNYTLAGGSVSELAGAPSALFVYRDAGNRLVLCAMYLGHADAVRPLAEVRQRPDGVTFYVVVREGRTAVFWQEGEIACVLVSDAGREATVQLAFAKAVKI